MSDLPKRLLVVDDFLSKDTIEELQEGLPDFRVVKVHTPLTGVAYDVILVTCQQGYDTMKYNQFLETQLDFPATMVIL